ncbi:MAG: competence/damage-inducible protein A [Clostridiales bacterium]|jgi:nicotinamide-nucleotide amidase|nr:competence/damage-inducible protein A [Clostridiales bacterium]
MKAEIIAVGTELLLGQIVNTNARYLSEKLAELGIDVYWQTVVGDNDLRIQEALNTALSRADLLIFSGGLGPTMDDLTKETVASVLSLPLEMDIDWENRIVGLFAKTGRTMTDNNRKQALIPQGARLLINDNGTAPGIWLEHGDSVIVMLPGPPRELEPMFAEKVMPLLRKEAGQIILSRVLKVTGIGESAMEEAIADLIRKQTNPTIAPLAKYTEVHLRVTAKTDTREEAEVLLDETEELLHERLGDAIFARNEETMADVIAKMLFATKLTLATAESCTGGLLAHYLTNVSGSSDYFIEGLITYSNRSKINLLGIKPAIIREYGAVSEETALSMAENVRRRADTDLALAVTGIAGPTGGSDQKPVGLVYIALASPDGVSCRRFNFMGKRENIKERAAIASLNILRLYLAKHYG